MTAIFRVVAYYNLRNFVKNAIIFQYFSSFFKNFKTTQILILTHTEAKSKRVFPTNKIKYAFCSFNGPIYSRNTVLSGFTGFADSLV